MKTRQGPKEEEEEEQGKEKKEEDKQEEEEGRREHAGHGPDQGWKGGGEGRRGRVK